MITENKHKTYVSVTADFDSDGRMLPRTILWEDGVRYKVDRVKSIRPSFSAKAGGHGDCYTIIVHGRETSIFFERSAQLTGNVIGRWFVIRASG